MMQTYSYFVTVTDGASVRHRISGTTEVEGDMRAACDAALRASFEKLTSGGATYGLPGVGGCRGPYTVERLEVERWPARCHSPESRR